MTIDSFFGFASDLTLLLTIITLALSFLYLFTSGSEGEE